MTINRLLASLFVVFCTFAWCGKAAAAAEPTRKFNFNGGWKLYVGDPAQASDVTFDDSSWKNVTLPRAFNEDDAFAKSIYELTTGVAWYRKHFVLPADAAGQRIILEFEGIRHGGQFFLNGKPIGRSENGVMAFGFDVTDAVRPAPQENVLAARIDNRWDYREAGTNSPFQWNDRNFYANYGGINKNVYLHLIAPLHQTLPLFSSLGTTGVYVYAHDIDIPNRRASISVESQIRNDGREPRTFTYDVSVHDMDGKSIKTFGSEEKTLGPAETTTARASANLDQLHFWSWGYGYLYTVTTTLKVDGQAVDVVRTRTGFRKTAFDHGMLTLNDRPIQIHGYAQRTTNEWPAVGLSVPAWVSDFSNGLMVRGNANLVRWMHVTPWKQDVESCDRVGLMQAMPAGDSEGDVTGRRWEQRVELLRDAIIYNRNNPSIIFYECGNKGISEAHMSQMKAVRDQCDPHGGRAIGAREMLDHDSVAEYGGEMLYINKSAGKPLWAMEFCRDEGNRKFWDEFTPPFHKVPVTNQYRKPARGEKQSDIPPAYEYNRNQDSFAIEDVTRWYDYWRQRSGTGDRVNAGGVNIIFSDSNTHFRGMQTYRCSGEVDAMRLPKDAYFANQIMWDGWVDVERPAAHILGHWNYSNDTTKDVCVVSSADKVELLLNGQSLGYGENSNRFLFTFKNVHWQPGVLQAVGYDASGRRVCATQLKTAGPPAALRLAAQTGPDGLRADGADLVMVDVEVVDAAGQRCPTALNLIHFKLTGPSEWRGGIAQDNNRPDNYVLSQDLPVQCGINRVLVRSTTQAGRITLAATADGLAPAAVEFDSLPTSESGGLTNDLPGTGLPSILDRVPQASPAPLAPSRRSLAIASATAGSHADAAALSFDDDETTSWSSDDSANNAWIQYELKAPATLAQASLKLPGWRTRSYPLRISVDGQEVFKGDTPRSLGYVTLQLKPTTGKTIRIEMTRKASGEKDGFDLVEVGNEPAPTTQRARGGLGIVEAEFYSSSDGR
jgi:beta-galactosidase